MPLNKSGTKAALDENMKTLHSEIGESKHVQSREQAVAIALNTQRRAKAKKRRSFHNGQVSDRARDQMRQGIS